MNKQILMAASALILSASISTPAFAGCDGFYMAGRGGIVNHNIGDGDSTLSSTKSELDDNALMLSGALGYRWGYFRLEGEYVWRDSTDDSYTEGATTYNSEFETSSYMANIYWDLSPYTWFTPYLSAGLGMTDISYSVNANDYDEDNFTWSVGGGLSAQVTNRFNIDLGYRYYDMGDLGEANIHTHEVYSGLRYVF